MAVTVTNDTAGALALGRLNKNTNDVRFGMDTQNGNLTTELDLYIKQNYRSADFCIKGLFDGMRPAYATGGHHGGAKWALDFLLKKLELSFSEKLMNLIEINGRTPADVYTKAGLTRAHFSKIKADKGYHPTKETALAFAIALHLDIDETSDLLKRAGYSLSHSSESDLIVEFFIARGIYSIDEINNQLDIRGHKTLTNWRKPADE